MSEVKTDKISSVSTNGDITLDPDGTGDLIVASGNVGIGTTSPGAGVDVAYAGSAAALRVYNSQATNPFGLLVDNTGANTSDSNYIADFRSGGTSRLRLLNSGSVGINTTSPNTSYKTTIQADSTKGALSIDGPSTNGYWAAEWDMPSGSTYGILFKNAGSNVGNIRINASSTSYNTSSDHRLKENVADLSGAIARVKQLVPKRFNFIADADTTVDGFLAHEAQTVVPEAVSGTHNEVDDDGNAVMQGIDQSKLVPLLTAALQEAITKIETLETKVTALENA
jgi:hypothetical protein